jgi:nucleoside-diphosphate-sugar epimerase
VDESAPYPERWLCHYPHTKAIAEQQVLAANGMGELATCALRPHLIWGPRDQHLIPRLIARARSGQLRRVGDGQNKIDMIYVENAAAGHLAAADALTSANAKAAGRAYFLSQGAPVNCWNWINQILSLANLPPVTKSVSKEAAWRIGIVFESVYKLLNIRSEPRMTRFLAAQLAADHYFDIRRAQVDFGYVPAISTEEGMRRLARELDGDGQAPRAAASRLRGSS